MKNFTSTFAALLLTGLPVMAADAPVANSSPATPDAIVSVLPLLQAAYPDFASLHYKDGDQLADLVTRSNGRLIMAQLQATMSAPGPIVFAALPSGVLYYRFASFAPKSDWTTFAADFRQALATPPALGIVLDLRSTGTPGDYAGAAQVASLLTPTGSHLSAFLPTHANDQPHIPMATDGTLSECPVVVLVNDHTAGAGEVLAAMLKADGALLIGRPTAGTTSFVDEIALGSGQVLRFSIAPPTMTNGTLLLTGPLIPDISLRVDERNEKAALLLIRDNHLSDVIQESAERHRLSEASLVRGLDPEYDDYLTSLEKPVLLSLPAVHDTTLISAIDSLRAIRLNGPIVPVQATAKVSLPTTSSVQ